MHAGVAGAFLHLFQSLPLLVELILHFLQAHQLPRLAGVVCDAFAGTVIGVRIHQVNLGSEPIDPTLQVRDFVFLRENLLPPLRGGALLRGALCRSFPARCGVRRRWRCVRIRRCRRVSVRVPGQIGIRDHFWRRGGGRLRSFLLLIFACDFSQRLAG